MNNKYAKVVVTDAFLALPEIKEIRAKYKTLGFAIVVLLQLELSKHKHCIGRISKLRQASHEAGIQLKTLLNIMDESSAFVMDYEHDIYYMPRLRKKFQLPIAPTKEEINDISCNGNVYFGYGEKNTKNVLSCPKKDDKDSKKIRKRFQIFKTQDVDNKGDTIFSYKDKDISLKDIDKDVKIKKDASRCSDDADDDIFLMEKILSFNSWRKSIKECHGIDLEDDVVFGIFVKWLYYHCSLNDKLDLDDTELRKYANNLVRIGTKTRTELDRYLENKINDKITEKYCSNDETKETPSVDYEHVENGVRYSSEGQLIPHDAPKQPSLNVAYSYISNKWIDIDDYDIDAETIAYDRNVAEIAGYLKGLETVA